jgi:hypothetical protein
MHACEVHAHEMHPHEVHPHETRAYEIHARDMHAHHCFGGSLVVDLSRSEFQNTSFCASGGVVAYSWRQINQHD